MSIADPCGAAKDSGAIRISLIAAVGTILSSGNAEPPIEELHTDHVARLLMISGGLPIAGVRAYAEDARSRLCRKTNPRAAGVEAR